MRACARVCARGGKEGSSGDRQGEERAFYMPRICIVFVYRSALSSLSFARLQRLPPTCFPLSLFSSLPVPRVVQNSWNPNMCGRGVTINGTQVTLDQSNSNIAVATVPYTSGMTLVLLCRCVLLYVCRCVPRGEGAGKGGQRLVC